MPHRTNVHNQTSAEWVVTGTSGAPAAQTLTKAAETGRRHYICGVHITALSDVAGIICSLKDGGVAKLTWFAVEDGVFVDFGAHPLEMLVNSAVTLEVATGGGAVITRANFWGYTLGA